MKYYDSTGQVWLFCSLRKIEFPTFEWIRFSRKWNISAAREQWGLGRFQLKCSMGRMECYERDAYHVGKHSRPTPRLAHVIFYLFIYLVYICFMWQFEFLGGFSLVSFRISISNLPCLLEYMFNKCGQGPSSRVAFFVGWAFQSMSHGSYPVEFLPRRVFFPAGILWPLLWQYSL